MSRPISNKQLRVLRVVAARAHRASTAQRGLAETVNASRAYQRELRGHRRAAERQLSELEWEGNAARRSSEASRIELLMAEIDERLHSVELEIQRLQVEVEAATSVSAPLNAVVRSMLEYFRAEPAELGILFGETDAYMARDLIVVGGPSASARGDQA